ncbi:MAG: tRNA uridine-5-carboxymethylaminomethyl(34) synthesis GTPase MnmE [bacterium]
MYLNDTIAALATAPGPAGVCVVRISGHDALKIADRLMPSTSHKPSERVGGTFFYTDIVHPQTHEKIDDALILVFHAPRSFTGEEVVEIQGHGGSLPSQRLVDAVLAAGARMAEPGEFSKRAFLNGRMDLTQAEAICDYIQSKSERMAHAARAQLDGQLGSRLTALYEAMMTHCADIEHQLDFDEGDLSETFLSETTQNLQQTMRPLAKMIQSWNNHGCMLREGALVVLSGKPNAGKSSLLNALLGRNRAIVHHVPGTTRDLIEETWLVEGIPLRLVDTAGLRISTDAVEQEGIARTRELMQQADVNLHLVDAVTATEEELALLSQDARSICVLTKSDLLLITEDLQRFDDAIWVSAKTGHGLELLAQAILKKLGVVSASAGVEIINQRHVQELRTAYTAAEQAHTLLVKRNLVIAANELRVAAEALGRIVGRTYTDDLLDTIFSRFCVGK